MKAPDSSRSRIWLIGGTSESARIAELLASVGLPCTITVTTETAQALYPQTNCLKVLVVRLDVNEMGNFLQQQQIAAVVDASHPHAVEISQGAIAAVHKHDIPYLRYERPQVSTGLAQKESRRVIELDSFATLLESDYLLGQRVLLAIGYKALPLFRVWQDRSTLFARLLPAVNSLQVALDCGFTSDRLIAIRPPVSLALEKALWEQWQISLVVTKASGKAGGEEVKRSVAAKLGIPLIAIARPTITYPRQTSDFAEVLGFCRHVLG